MWRILAVGAAATIVVAACGGRSDLSGGRTTSSTTSQGGATTSTTNVGAGGAGGGLILCDEPMWDDTVVRIEAPLAFGARLELVAMDPGQSRVALVATDRPNDNGAMVSWLVDDFETWPPQISEHSPHFPLLNDTWSFQVMPRDGEEFGFGVLDPFANTLFIGRAEPGQNGSTIREVMANGRLAAFSHRPFSPFLVTTQGGSFLREAWYPANLPDFPGVERDHCIDTALIQTASVALPGGQIFSAVNGSTSDCFDPGPVQPPTQVSVTRFAPDGTAAVATTFVADDIGYYHGGPVDDLSIVHDKDGAIVTFRGLDNPNNQPIHVVAQLDATASVAAFNGIVAESVFTRRFASWPDGYVETHVDNTGFTSSLIVSFSRWNQGVYGTPQNAPPGDFRGKPAIIVAPDGRSATVAVINQENGQAIELHRVVCGTFSQ